MWDRVVHAILALGSREGGLQPFRIANTRFQALETAPGVFPKGSLLGFA